MPVRKIPKNYRSVTGRFSSLKNGRAMAFESTLERDFFLSLEFDDTVESYEEQPLTISAEIDGTARKYTPDCLALHFDGTETLYEVKYVADLEKKDDDLALRFSMAERYACERGITFQVVSELDIRGVKLENQRFLYGFSTPPKDFNNLRQTIIDLMENPLALESLLSGLSPDRMKQAAYIPTVWHLVFTGQLQIDMDIPINNKTIIQVSHGTHLS